MSVSVSDELERLHRLRNTGAISHEEFEAAKATVLGARVLPEHQRVVCAARFTCPGCARCLRLSFALIGMGMAISGVALTVLVKNCFLCPDQPTVEFPDSATCSEKLYFLPDSVEWYNSTVKTTVRWAEFDSMSSNTLFDGSLATFTFGSSVFHGIEEDFAAYKICMGLTLALMIVVLSARSVQCCLLPCNLRPDHDVRHGWIVSTVANAALISLEITALISCTCGVAYLLQTKFASEESDNSLVSYYPSDCELNSVEAPAVAVAIVLLVSSLLCILFSSCLLCAEHCVDRVPIHVQHAAPHGVQHGVLQLQPYAGTNTQQVRMAPIAQPPPAPPAGYVVAMPTNSNQPDATPDVALGVPFPMKQ